jgi:hypothetical protein
MTIGLATIAMVMVLWFLGAWLRHLENMEHPSRYQGRYRTPCLDVANHGDHKVDASRPLEFC